MSQDLSEPGFPIVLIPLGFAIVFPLLWCGIAKAISLVGGWAGLAERFPGGSVAPARSWSMQSGTLGTFANYRNVLKVGVGPEGLFLDVFPLFRVGHPPILVPWDEVEVGAEETFFFFRATPIRFPRQDLRLRLTGTIGDEIRRAAGEWGKKG